MQLHILGIRHHGVGSARNVTESLKKLKPDIILVEGPPELDSVVSWVANKELKPPVAVLAYNPDKPSQAVFYPFAKFSPEWQAISFALQNNIPVKMLDLPLAYSFGMELKKKEEARTQEKEDRSEVENEVLESIPDSEILNSPFPIQKDPISQLAELAGYSDGELWWEHNFEQKFLKGSATEHFEAVFEAMNALREHIQSPASERDDLREAYMRKIIRQAEKDGFQKAVVICGAWHAPVLTNFSEEKVAEEDEKMLKKLPEVPVNCTWIPWTNTRLGMFTGYGAGIVSPGWYEHLWNYPEDKGIRWLARVARVFRDKKMDTSTAHIIEAYRLAEALAAMRDLARPGLVELNEATETVICFGDTILLKLVREELIVGKSVIGKVPKELPKLPIQADFEENRKKLRFEILEANKEYELDLRKELDLNRSRFLHRLEILGIKWGQKTNLNTKGTFKEGWRLKWQPELEIDLIEKGFWGNTVHEATSKFLLNNTEQSQSIAELAGFIQQAIPAELFEAIEKILVRLNDLATVSADIMELMAALTPLVNVSRYGNVRKTDLSAVNKLVEGFITRICIGLPNASYGLDENNSNLMFANIRNTDAAVRLLEDKELQENWYKTLHLLLDKQGVNPIITGCTCRLLFDGKELDETETARRFNLALSAGNEPKDAAGWIEGFLKGSGMILILDNTLWNILYKWVSGLEKENFTELLPILRRTFSKFDPTERKQLGEKAKKGVIISQLSSSGNLVQTSETASFNEERAAKSLDVVKLLLGLN